MSTYLEDKKHKENKKNKQKKKILTIPPLALGIWV